MCPGEALGDGRTRPPGFPPEFSDFPNPFQGLGIPGSSGFFDGFFSCNPFDDPFFIRPLGSMFGSTGGLFGPGGFMGMGGLLGNRRPDGAFLDQMPFHPPQGGSRKGPVIEELPDDHEDSPEKNRRGRQHPIVEHLDEDVTAAGITRQTRSQAEQEQFFQNSGYQSNPGYQSFSFQSASTTFGGARGSYFSSSSTSRRVGADGVMEEQHFAKDSSGKEIRSTARGLRDKVHAITKKRNASGQELTVDTLQNLTPEEATNFDAHWEARSQKSLPGWNRSRSQTLEGSSSSSTHQRPPPLLYNEGSEHLWPGASLELDGLEDILQYCSLYAYGTFICAGGKSMLAIDCIVTSSNTFLCRQ